MLKNLRKRRTPRFLWIMWIKWISYKEIIRKQDKIGKKDIHNFLLKIFKRKLWICG